MVHRLPKVLGFARYPKFTRARLAVALSFVMALVTGALYELARSEREATLRAACEIDALAIFAAMGPSERQAFIDVLERLDANLCTRGDGPSAPEADTSGQPIRGENLVLYIPTK